MCVCVAALFPGETCVKVCVWWCVGRVCKRERDSQKPPARVKGGWQGGGVGGVVCRKITWLSVQRK